MSNVEPKSELIKILVRSIRLLAITYAVGFLCLLICIVFASEFEIAKIRAVTFDLLLLKLATAPAVIGLQAIPATTGASAQA